MISYRRGYLRERNIAVASDARLEMVTRMPIPTEGYALLFQNTQCSEQKCVILIEEVFLVIMLMIQTMSKFRMSPNR